MGAVATEIIIPVTGYLAWNITRRCWNPNVTEERRQFYAASGSSIRSGPWNKITAEAKAEHGELASV